MSVKFPFLGFFFFGGGGGSADFIFMGARIFLKNRRSLAFLDRKEIAHFGAAKIARFCGGAKNRAILVHSVFDQI